ncbi:MAG: hypothetical protein ABSC48_17900 [Terracidiphilus sp.]|jgi:hypothetical protein
MYGLAQNEVLKFMASVATPVTIAVFGILINRTIQKQNAITQRQSSWLEKWADDFLKIASEFNESATSFIMLFQTVAYKSDWKKNGNFVEDNEDEEMELFKREVMRLLLALLRGWREVSMYTNFAPLNGKDLQGAAQALFNEANIWISNKGGNIDTFLEKQLAFNKHARDVHAELLGFQGKKRKHPPS